MATVEISCVEVWREISDYLEEDISADLRVRMEAHFKVCAHCSAVLDGMRNVVGLVADEAYELGRAMAVVGMKSLLGQKTPEFIVAPVLTVTKENIAQGWHDSLNRDAPQSVLDAAR